MSPNLSSCLILSLLLLAILPQGRVTLLHEISPCRDRCPCLTKYHSAKKAPLSVTPQERGPTAHQALLHREGPPSHLSITPQGMTPIVHPSNATQTAQQRAATLARPALCQGSSALPTAFQGSSHGGGHPGRTWQGPVAAASLALGTGAAQETCSGDPCPAWHSSALPGAAAPAQVEGTHIPLHTQGPQFRGCCAPAPPGK